MLTHLLSYLYSLPFTVLSFSIPRERQEHNIGSQQLHINWKDNS